MKLNFPADHQVQALRQTQPVGIIFTQSQKKELNYYYVA